MTSRRALLSGKRDGPRRPEKSDGSGVAILQTALLLLPGAYVLRLALLAGPLPDWDYWTILASVIDEGGFTANLSAWLRPQNEHFLIFTRLIYALNVGLSGGHNVGLALWAWGAAFTQALLLAWLARRTLRNEPGNLPSVTGASRKVVLGTIHSP